MTETAFQRIGREQRERQEARAKRQADYLAAERKAARKASRARRDGIRERRYLDSLVSDHNHEMDS